MGIRYGAAAVAAALVTALTPAPAEAGGKPLSATGKACTVVGTHANDRLFGTHGYDVICGLGGNDVITGGGGKDVVDGGEGDDDVDGEDGADTVIGGPGNDTVKGGKGHDKVRGGTENDIVDGGDGADLADGGEGDDTVGGGVTETDPAAGGDRVIGGDGADILTGGPGADTLKGGAGDDAVDGGDGSDLAGGDGGNDTVAGGEGGDRLDGGDDTDSLDGGGGSDGVNGGGGDDTLAGGVGDDTVRGGDGNDQAAGGEGDDRLSGGAGNDTVSGGDGTDELTGGAGDDTMTGGGGDDTIAGGDGTDSLIGGDGSDTMDGGGGNDTIAGGEGADRLIGGDGNDIMDGGGGDDAMDGGIGDDRMDGGAGNDDVEGGPGLNTCVPDSGDASGDKCTDKATPRIDVASLEWSGGSTVANDKQTRVTLRGHITDDRSGVVAVEAWLRNPEPGGPSLYFRATDANVVAGTGYTHDGTFEMTATLPALSRSGEWGIDHIYLRDRVNRWSRYAIRPDGGYTISTSMSESGSGRSALVPLTVTGEYDAAAPVPDTAAARWVTPATQDNAVQRDVTVEIPVTDDLSGANGVAVYMRRAGETNGPLSYLGNAVLFSGTARDGVWRVSGRIPAFLPAGEWQIYQIYLRDGAGRNRWLARPSGAVDGVDWPSPLTVAGETSDLQRPALDLSAGELVAGDRGDNSVDRTFRMKIRASDDVSGISSMYAHVSTPGGNGYPGAESNIHLVSTVAIDGFYEMQGILPATTTPGQWRIDKITVQDRVGWQRVYDIAANGDYTTSDGLTGTAVLPQYTLTTIGS